MMNVYLQEEDTQTAAPTEGGEESNGMGGEATPATETPSEGGSDMGGGMGTPSEGGESTPSEGEGQTM